MNALNRLLGILFLLLLLAASLAVLLWATSVLRFEASTAGGAIAFPYMPSQEFYLRAPRLLQGTREWWGFVGGSAGALLLSLLLLALELRTMAPESVLVLHQTSRGVTELSLGAILQLARWIGEDTPGVEQFPSARVHVRRGKIELRGLAVVNPFVNAREVAARLQNRLEERLSAACGSPARVRISTRFQDPRVRRGVR